jgi:hypothetical protein
MKKQNEEHLDFFKGLAAAIFFFFIIWAGLWVVLHDIGDGKIVPGPLKTERVIGGDVK